MVIKKVLDDLDARPVYSSVEIPSTATGIVICQRDDLGHIITVEKGRGYLARVLGSSQALLDDGDLAAVINWVLTEFNSATLVDDFEPLTAAEVKEERENTLKDPLKFRTRLLREYQDI